VFVASRLNLEVECIFQLAQTNLCELKKKIDLVDGYFVASPLNDRVIFVSEGIPFALFSKATLRT
jgi:hypothetical protein